MLMRLLTTAAAVTLAAGMGYAGQSRTITAVPTDPPGPKDGKMMFAHYCAPCHGADGKGYGPVVTEQKAPPVDLTVLSRKNRGRFPEARVIYVLKNGSQVLSHTSVEMPVWGPILGKINQHDPRDKMVRVSNLSRFLESLQVK